MITLQRITHSDDGTFGVLMKGRRPLCVTLEDPWNDNRRNVSCIPEGIYQCVPHNGTKYKNVWRLKDVPGRSAILIHAGNTIADTQGCILVGTRFYAPPGKAGIGSSMAALNMLREYLPNTFEIDVKNPPT